jgi:predicted metal-binding membrane protein
MRSLATRRVVELRRTGAGRVATAAWQLRALSAAIVAAWLVAAGAQLSGHATLLHHHTLIEGGSPLRVALPFFLLGWQVMIAAMMLPASLPSIGVFNAGLARPEGRRRGMAAFLASYALVWSLFGLVAFLGDDVLHHIVDATPWLAARPWLIEAAVVAIAGAYQLTPLKRRWLAACRHPAALLSSDATALHRARWVGLDHALACLGSSWALMLLMFAEGFANLWWMVALTAVMVYETTGRNGQWVATTIGIALLVFGAVLLVAMGIGPGL